MPPKKIIKAQDEGLTVEIKKTLPKKKTETKKETKKNKKEQDKKEEDNIPRNEVKVVSDKNENNVVSDKNENNVVSDKNENNVVSDKNETILLPYPNGVPEPKDFHTILRSFFVYQHRYVALSERRNKNKVDENMVEPVFLVISDPHWTDEGIPCYFVRHTSTVDAQGETHVVPVWEDVESQGMVTEAAIYNCMPFDETRDYHFTKVD